MSDKIFEKEEYRIAKTLATEQRSFDTGAILEKSLLKFNHLLFTLLMPSIILASKISALPNKTMIVLLLVFSTLSIFTINIRYLLNKSSHTKAAEHMYKNNGSELMCGTIDLISRHFLIFSFIFTSTTILLLSTYAIMAILY